MYKSYKGGFGKTIFFVPCILHSADTLIGVLSSLRWCGGHSAEIPIQWQNADMIIAHCQHAQSLMMVISTRMIMPLLALPARWLAHSIQIVSQRLKILFALPTWIFRPFSDLNSFSHWLHSSDDNAFASVRLLVHSIPIVSQRLENGPVAICVRTYRLQVRIIRLASLSPLHAFFCSCMQRRMEKYSN